ncbi:MAG: hypothetical protein ACLP9L_24995 [Thermoguttaceae bacterium]
MKALKRIFAEARARYSALKKTCEAQVTRWEWATFWLYDMEPFCRERNRISRGKRLKTKPTTIKSGMHQYGFDASNRIVVVRQYTEFKGRFNEEFFTYSNGVVESVLFADDPDTCSRLLRIAS